MLLYYGYMVFYMMFSTSLIGIPSREQTSVRQVMAIRQYLSCGIVGNPARLAKIRLMQLTIQSFPCPWPRQRSNLNDRP